jgi:hypothetical protein
VDALKITRGKRPGSYLIKIDHDGTGDKAWWEETVCLFTCFHLSLVKQNNDPFWFLTKTQASGKLNIKYRLCLYRLKLSSKGVPQLVEVFDEVRKRHFFRHLYIKCIILPRQARDKHRESSKKSAVFPGSRRPHVLIAVRRTPLFCAIYWCMKTGSLSRQTRHKHRDSTLKTEMRLSQDSKTRQQQQRGDPRGGFQAPTGAVVVPFRYRAATAGPVAVCVSGHPSGSFPGKTTTFCTKKWSFHQDRLQTNRRKAPKPKDLVSLFLSFSYVCPEPVLVKWSFLPVYIWIAPNDRWFLAAADALQVLGGGRVYARRVGLAGHRAASDGKKKLPFSPTTFWSD